MKRKFHIFLSYIMLAVVLFTALPKVYIHKIMGHNHVLEQSSAKGLEASIQEDNKTQNCNLEKFETPVFFTEISFVSNCKPVLPFVEKLQFVSIENAISQYSFALSLLRGPPQV